MLARHNKGAAHIAVFHKPLPIRLIQNARNFQRGIGRGFRNWNDYVDIEIFPLTGNFFTEFGAHAHARAIDGNLVEERIRAGKIDVFKQAGIAFRILSALAGRKLALLGDIHRFTWRNVTNELKSQRIQRHTL